MGGNWLKSLRRHRCVVIAWVAMSLMMPLVLGLLPQPALSAVQSLDRDIALSICSQLDGQQRDGGQHDQATHDCCILCSTNCPVCGPSLAKAMVAYDAIPAYWGTTFYDDFGDLLPPRLVLLDGSPPRGPPDAFLI